MEKLLLTHNLLNDAEICNEKLNRKENARFFLEKNCKKIKKKRLNKNYNFARNSANFVSHHGLLETYRQFLWCFLDSF